MGGFSSLESSQVRRIGAWELRALLGRGATGSVYEGHNIRDGRSAAVKVLHPHLATDGVASARFLREAGALSRIAHPNVVEVFEVGEHDGMPYLAMSVVDGEDLGDHLRRLHPMSLAHVADCILPVIDAVASAHDLGIVHRDLKPSNIRVSRCDDGRVTPKVLDFGISKVTRDDLPTDLTGTGQALGTVSYMSPEQVRSAKHVDIRTDVYALGVILYECATGRRPFRANNSYDLMHAILTAAVPPPSSLRDDLTPAFDSLVGRAMHRDPLHRFATARELGDALAALISANPSSFVPPAGLGDRGTVVGRSVLKTIGENWLHMTDFERGVVRHSCKGRFSAEFVPFITAHGDEQIQRFGRVVFMVDGWGLTVTADFRDALTSWLRPHRDVVIAHILICSTLIDMAISVTNLFTGKPVLIPHSDPPRWEKIGRQEDPTFTRLPPGTIR